MDFETDEQYQSAYEMACGDFHKMKLYTDSKEGAERVCSLLSTATVLDIQTFCYDDFDNDGHYEVFFTWKSREGKQVLEYLSPEGKSLDLWEGETPDPDILQAGNHKYFRFMYQTSDSSDESRMLILGIKDGNIYQPSISGQFSQFGSTDWTEYYDIPSNAPKGSFYSCTNNPEAVNDNSAWEDCTYYTYDEEQRQFVPIN